MSSNIASKEHAAWKQLGMLPMEFIETIPEVEEGPLFGPPITTEPLRLARGPPGQRNCRSVATTL